MKARVRRQKAGLTGGNRGQSLGAPASDSARYSPRFRRGQKVEKSADPRELVAAIKRDLAAAADPEYRESVQRFFKEPIDVYGVRTSDARRISNEYFKKVRHLPKREIFEICELLHNPGLGHDHPRKRGQSLGARGRAVQSPFSRSCPAPSYEEHGVAFSWAGRLNAQFEPADFLVLERWLRNYVSNWAACDTLCGGPFGDFLIRFPKFLPTVRKWAKSENRWLRRASAVTLIPALKTEPEIHHQGTKAQRGTGRGEVPEAGTRSRYVSQAYQTADILLLDEDDMVQKGYGWMLKELANRRPREVFEFVLARRDRMPRTALRYAIEKMPAAWKKQAMAR